VRAATLHQNCLRREKCVVIVVDIQEKFRSAIEGFDEIADNAAKLLKGCTLLGIPTLVTEQYPQGLGPTVTPIRNQLGEEKPMEKTAFSCMGADGFLERMQHLGADTAIVCGIETHVCVNQTVHALLERGLRVHVVVDAVGSRKSVDHATALRKMELAGAVPSTLEMCLFELLGDARHEWFREIQRLVK
jgi:nicotinamidase-related amidase